MKVRTHYLLAKLSLNNLSNDIPEKFNKTFFYLGTIIADCCLLPFTNPHYFNDSFAYVNKSIYKLSKERSFSNINSLKLGIIIHYLCDFCCHSHINDCIGNPNNHMLYERRIQKYLIKNIENYKNNFNVISLYKANKNSLSSSETRKLVKFIDFHVNAYRKGVPSFEWDITSSLIVSKRICDKFFEMFNNKEYKEPILTNESCLDATRVKNKRSAK